MQIKRHSYGRSPGGESSSAICILIDMSNDSRFELKLSWARRAELDLGGINQVDKQMVPVDFDSSFGV